MAALWVGDGPVHDFPEIGVASILYIDVRKGMVILHEGQLCLCVDRELRTPGNLPSKLTIKIKNLKTGLVNEVRVHPENKVEQAYLDRREAEYLYKDSDGYVFMDKETFDQFTLAEDMVGDLPLFLKENNTCQVTFYDGKPLSIDLPAQVELKVTETDPALKGATAAAQYKPATLETGLKINVPPHIAIGDMVSVSTAEGGKYLGRAK
jgi:elongation factor P